MFSSKEYLEKKTGKWGVGRFKYLQTLVTEFQDTSKHEYKLQVLANLANFGYDPINYEYFRQLNILDLFLDVLAEENDEKMIEFAMGGVCNCCLDEKNKAYLLENECVDFTVKCLSSSNEETVLSAITALLYLTTTESKKAITEAHIVDLMRRFTGSSNTRLSNLATIFLEDICGQSAVAPPVKKTRVEASDDESEGKKD
jgi:hypothetical protein